MIEQIKVFAADIDGTLALKGDNIMPLTREALNKLHAEGVKIGLASGRPMDQRILENAKKWGLDFEFDFCIGTNGSDLYDKETGKTDHYYQLNKDVLLEILNFLDLDQVSNALVYNDGYNEISSLRMDDFMRDSQQRNHSNVQLGDKYFLAREDVGKLEVHLTSEQLPLFLERCKENESDRWSVIKTFEGFGHITYEFQCPGVHKGIALEQYCKRHGFALDEVIAFGDMENDLGLLKTAGWGVCLQNGSDAVKAIANAVTEHPVTDDGVGHYLFDHYFNK